MNDADVSKQIEQMVRFIRQEAEEKANEISVSAEEVSLLSLSLSIDFVDWSLQLFYLTFGSYDSDLLNRDVTGI